MKLEKHRQLKTVLGVVLALVAVIGLSMVSTRLWGAKTEEAPKQQKLVLAPQMTVGQFGQANDLPRPVLKEVFKLQSQSDLAKALDQYGTAEQVAAMVTKKLALSAEHASKNWIKIPLKFTLWFVFLTTVFIWCKKRTVTPRLRKALLFAAVMVFGVAMGADPGPMGTVKDAIMLYATAGAVFAPRMIALAVFLAMVFLANKYICAWGCQAGTLQDLLFRLNRTDAHQAIIGRQVKPPFVLTNTVRCVFFGVFVIGAFAWTIDIVDPIDPFKLFKPMRIGEIGIAFLASLLVASLFVYRPWCHLFCPFGLVGWLVEKASRVRISVNYQTCIACEKCATACPSTVMGAILHGDTQTIPDCFACYTCRDACPTGSIRFASAKRDTPPAGHFDRLAARPGRDETR